MRKGIAKLPGDKKLQEECFVFVSSELTHMNEHGYAWLETGRPGETSREIPARPDGWNATTLSFTPSAPLPSSPTEQKHSLGVAPRDILSINVTRVELVLGVARHLSNHLRSRRHVYKLHRNTSFQGRRGGRGRPAPGTARLPSQDGVEIPHRLTGVLELVPVDSPPLPHANKYFCSLAMQGFTVQKIMAVPTLAEQILLPLTSPHLF